MVLATDMKYHFEHLGRLKTRLMSDAFVTVDRKDVLFLLGQARALHMQYAACALCMQCAARALCMDGRPLLAGAGGARRRHLQPSQGADAADPLDPEGDDEP
eukprot:scaffold91104_cov87-Phaeocystis_antarctica.AAC.1